MITGLEDKVVLVTGGAGGIGEAICRAFSSEGSQVIVHYHNSFDNAQTSFGGRSTKSHRRYLSLLISTF